MRTRREQNAILVTVVMSTPIVTSGTVRVASVNKSALEVRPVVCDHRRDARSTIKDLLCYISLEQNREGKSFAISYILRNTIIMSDDLQYNHTPLNMH